MWKGKIVIYEKITYFLTPPSATPLSFKEPFWTKSYSDDMIELFKFVMDL